MNTTYADRLKANDDILSDLHQQRLAALGDALDACVQRHEAERSRLSQATQQEARSACVRQKVRDILGLLLDPEHNGDLPQDELLLAALNWVAGMLACTPLDEAAGLKVRRIGRLMDVQNIPF